MPKIFVSYSSKDEELVDRFLEFLMRGMGVSEDDIFCTRLAGTLPAGTDFLARIRTELRENGIVIPLITPNYMKSEFCLMELGASWALSGDGGKRFYPVLAETMTYESMNHTPLKNIQMLRIDRRQDLGDLYDLLCEDKAARRRTSVFNQKLDVFMNDLAKRNDPGKDGDGYYHAIVADVRNVPENYRCYKINGRIDLGPGVTYQEGETHWIFYHKGMNPDLQPGDRIRFKVSRTELRNFPDLKNARNIYLDALERC